MKYFIIAIFSSLFLWSCDVKEGEGGSSSIIGKVYVHDYNSIGVYKSSYFGPNERVYILFGNDSVPGEDVRTGPNGDFRFDYLMPGSYTVYAYSDCDTCASGTEAVKVSVQIERNASVVDAGTLVIRD